MKKQSIGAVIMSVVAVIFILSMFMQKTEIKTMMIYDAFNTNCELKILSGKNGDNILQKCSLYLHETDNALSAYNQDSEISKLNSSAGSSAVALSEETMDILDKSYQYSLYTNGFFDITVGALENLWNAHNEIPTNEEITEAIHKTGLDMLTLDKEKKCASLSKEGVSVTLGGIAKGYAIKGVLDILKKENVTSAHINLGNDIYVMGKQLDGSLWNVELNNLTDGVQPVGSLKLYDTAISTSDSKKIYFKQDNNRYHHILNPFTGMPSNSGLLSVTVINNDPILADVLSTACFVIGYKDSLSLIRESQSMAIYVTDDNTVYYSSALQSYFEHNNPFFEYKSFE